MIGQDVVFECHFLHCSVRTEGAGKRLFPRVGPNVCHQVGLGGGAVGAVSAGEGLLSCVGPNVSVQIGLKVSCVEAVCAMKHFP